jgi:indole-3-glycerol phosphate synthase
MPAYLDPILAAHRARAAVDDRDLAAEFERAISTPPTRPFIVAIEEGANRDGIAVISEIKRRSPSKGDLDLGLDPTALAREYQAGGASCLSVLTDSEFFGGSAADLELARTSCALPVLRKDFTVAPLDVCDARTMGADAVLLIVAALTDPELASFLELADRLSLAALVEVHDESELQRALGAGARLIGVNQRDLRTFEVDRKRAVTLGELIPSDVVAVAESGIRDAADVSALAAAGYRAVLVGETLVRSGDRRATLADLIGSGR